MENSLCFYGARLGVCVCEYVLVCVGRVDAGRPLRRHCADTHTQTQHVRRAAAAERIELPPHALPTMLSFPTARRPTMMSMLCAHETCTRTRARAFAHTRREINLFLHSAKCAALVVLYSIERIHTVRDCCLCAARRLRACLCVCVMCIHFIEIERDVRAACVSVCARKHAPQSRSWR